MTPDPRSRQVVQRMTHLTYWIDKPLVVAGMIENTLSEGMAKNDENQKAYMRKGAENFLKGPPYQDPTIIDG